MAFKMKGHSLPGPHQRKSPAKHTMKFSENTSPGEIDAVGAHNKAHQKGVPADHSKGLVVDKIYDPNKKKARKKASDESPAKHNMTTGKGSGGGDYVQHTHDPKSNKPRISGKNPGTTKKVDEIHYPSKKEARKKASKSPAKATEDREKYEQVKATKGNDATKLAAITKAYGGEWSVQDGQFKNKEGRSVIQEATKSSKRKSAAKKKSPAKHPIMDSMGIRPKETREHYAKVKHEGGTTTGPEGGKHVKEGEKNPAKEQKAGSKKATGEKSPAKCPLLAAIPAVMGAVGALKKNKE